MGRRSKKQKADPRKVKITQVARLARAEFNLVEQMAMRISNAGCVGFFGSLRIMALVAPHLEEIGGPEAWESASLGVIRCQERLEEDLEASVTRVVEHIAVLEATGYPLTEALIREGEEEDVMTA